MGTFNEAKHTYSTYSFATYCENLEKLEKEKSVEEETDNPNYRQGQRKIDQEKRANAGSKGDSAEDKTASAAQKKALAAQRRKQKEREHDAKKLLPYEYTSQKEAERAASHLGLHGSHTAGNGIYKPGSSEYALRDAVHRKKQKQKMRGGYLRRESTEGLSTGVGIENPEQVLAVIKRVVRGE